MSFLRKALSHLVELDEAVPTRVASPQPTSAPVQFKPVISTAQVEKFSAHFEQLFEASNLPGPDYFEFTKAVDAMEADIPDERARMKAAFSTLKVQGVTKELLVNTANQYIAIVNADREAMEAEVEQKNKTHIAPLETAVNEANRAVNDDERRIQELQAGLAAKRQRAVEAQQAVAAAKEKLGANIEGYQTACTAMVARINEDIENIKTIL